MPRVIDFRSAGQFSTIRINNCGSSVGRAVYPKLYSIENLFRIMIHSILTAQIGAAWWQTAVNQRIQNKVIGYQNTYSRRPWHTNPGRHEIYYTDLGDLLEIAQTNAHLLAVVVTDINQWVVKIESVRLPRNVAAHMNFLNSQDRKRIDVLHTDLNTLLDSLRANPLLTLQIP